MGYPARRRTRWLTGPADAVRVTPCRITIALSAAAPIDGRSIAEANLDAAQLTEIRDHCISRTDGQRRHTRSRGHDLACAKRDAEARQFIGEPCERHAGI